ncbi:MAG: hypothetical protein NTZ46_00785 [Verrucomicrobia bacterium]|nr:hypothetical protein [Verrucomicrobiota bacterium]
MMIVSWRRLACSETSPGSARLMSSQVDLFAPKSGFQARALNANFKPAKEQFEGRDFKDTALSQSPNSSTSSGASQLALTIS